MHEVSEIMTLDGGGVKRNEKIITGFSKFQHGDGGRTSNHPRLVKLEDSLIGREWRGGDVSYFYVETSEKSQRNIPILYPTYILSFSSNLS